MQDSRFFFFTFWLDSITFMISIYSFKKNKIFLSWIDTVKRRMNVGKYKFVTPWQKGYMILLNKNSKEMRNFLGKECKTEKTQKAEKKMAS